MKKSVYFLLIVFLSSTVACVPARKLEELQVKYDTLQ
ncbi:MAG: hypothetical protein ACI95K_001837, partial [Lentimonas sp.]